MSRFARALRSGLVAALALATATAAATRADNAPATAAIDVDAAAVAGPISPLLYGQFLEFMFEGIKGGLYAELLRNRGFEEPPSAIGLSRGWERYPDDRNDDYGISFAWDDAVAYPEKGGDGTEHSLRVELRPAVIARHGVYQARVPVRQGVEYRGSLWVKRGTFTGSMQVALEADAAGGQIYDDAAIEAPSGEWTRYTFALTPGVTDPLARFAVLFDGTGTIWVDQVSLLPGDAVDGVRADVLERVKALRPAFIRWPGGNVAQDYHWQWGIGPRDERPTWVNLSWKNEMEPSDFGTDEFVQFARNIGAEPTITVNVDGRGATVDDAAAWVEYCNGSSSSKYGALRVSHGAVEPHRVKYWEIGNEIWGDWVRGHSDAATYARNLNRYVAAMRAVDPSIQVIAVGDNDMAWNRTVLRMVTARLDYVAIHHYYSHRDMAGDLRNLMARPLRYERFYGEMEAALRELPPDRRPKLAINEWGLDVPESQQYSILAALYGARLMNVFERRGDVVGMSAVSDLVNGWPGGIIQASRQGVFVTPIYLVNQLYATRLGAERLTARAAGPTFSSSREGRDVPAVDVAASRSADRGTIFLKVVNTDLERLIQARVHVRGLPIASHATVERVVADSLDPVNGFQTPDAVRIVREEVAAGDSFVLDLPPHSVSVVTLRAR